MARRSEAKAAPCQGEHENFQENAGSPRTVRPTNILLSLAEGVSSVIEVKSTLPSQWDQVLATRDKLLPLRRKYRDGSITRGNVSERVPLYIIAYQGWNQLETMKKKINEEGIDGILILGPQPLFSGRLYGTEVQTGTEENAMWAFICALHFNATQILNATCDLFAYGRPQQEEKR